MENKNLLELTLCDEEWPAVPADHDREIVRAIVIDDEGSYYFVRIRRDDRRRPVRCDNTVMTISGKPP